MRGLGGGGRCHEECKEKEDRRERGMRTESSLHRGFPAGRADGLAAGQRQVPSAPDAAVRLEVRHVTFALAWCSGRCHSRLSMTARRAATASQASAKRR